MEHTLLEKQDETTGRPLLEENDLRVSCRDLDLFYGEQCVLHDINLDIGAKDVLAIIGPSGSGKSSFLRCLNRMNDTVANCVIQGKITLDGRDIYDPAVDVIALRIRVGMVFQKPTPFPKSIYDNVAYGPRIHGMVAEQGELDALVEASLQRAGLWDEVKDRLPSGAMALSSGQQQRLCIARSLAVKPDVLLMDEPCSGLDPIATAKVEDLVNDLRNTCSIILVSHSLEQAARISQRTAFFERGRLVEVDATQRFFTTPKNPLTEQYLTGRLS